MPATLLLAALLLSSIPALAQDRLFEQVPYDRITLNAANENKVLGVQTLDLPDRQLPENPPSGRKLLIHLLDQPDKTYEVKWGAIAKVELFEQRVLQEAVGLVEKQRFDEAYDYFDFLRKKYPAMPGLKPAIEDYLYKQAGALHVAKKYDAALAILRELYGRDKAWPKLDAALGMTTEELVKQYIAAEDYYAARHLLRSLAAWYPEHPVVTKWEGQLQKQAAEAQAEARSALASGDLHKADGAARRMTHLWPALSGAAELLDTVRRKYPRVVVGVNAPAAVNRPGVLDDRASRRSGRLLYRTLMEFAGPGTDGGRYRCPVGTMEIEELGRRLVFQLQPGTGWASGGATLTGYDVSGQLLAMADPRRPEYRPEWAQLLSSAAVRDVDGVDADLRRTHVRPDALLQTILVPYGTPASPGRAEPTNGPYTVLSRTAEEVCYAASPHYFAAGAAQPKEIVERTYAKGVEAIRDLKRGRIELVDRVNPWELERLGADKTLVVEPYGVPLVHVLVPNMHKPLLAQRRFRRALVYGIHREVILRYLTGGAKAPGCRVLSGPFPFGITHDDPLGYAYDRSLKPRPYDPRLALALARVALDEVAAAEKKRGREMSGMPQLVLAHPPGEIARAACQAIQRQLKVVGIPVMLEEVLPSRLAEHPDRYDLVYAELAVWEPVVDAPRLLGEHGPAGGCSPYMSLVLSRLQRAEDWNEARVLLPQVHRIAHEDVALVPLWQMVDHLAYRKDLRGVGTRPVLLYQNVEQWQLASSQAKEAP